MSLNVKNGKPLDTIIKGCKEKDKYCQELLYKMFAGRVLTTCRRYEQSDYEAEDILHDAFILVFEKINKYNESKGNIESWIKKISVNVALGHLRKKRINFVEDIESTPFQQKNIVLENSIGKKEQILGIIKSLPLGYRTVFNMYVIEGFDHKEIASYLNISTSTSMSQLSKAKKMIKERYNRLVNKPNNSKKRL